MSMNPSADPRAPTPAPARGADANTTVGAVIALALGMAAAALAFLALLGGAATAALFFQRGPDGYAATPARELSAASYALVSPAVRLGAETLPFDPGSLRLAAEPTEPGGAVFIGIGPADDVEGYLRGVHTTAVTGVETSPFEFNTRDVPGPVAPAPPAGQGFWIAAASGTGPQQVDIELRSGDWVAVVMNPDAGAGISARLRVEIKSGAFGAATAVLCVAGMAALAIGTGLVVLGAVALGERTPSAGVSAHPGAVYPARLAGRLDPRLSRWLWLLKWLLVVPHVLILCFLWFALLLTTVASGFAVLFTGRYPRPLFNFAVGVLRWGWRVSFYAYSALGTDAYPPFTLASTRGDTGSPATRQAADFEIDYPQRLSRGLVLVKWWLLALPHLLIVSILAGGAGASLLGLLVFIAALALLFTGRYPRPLFDLAMGINRWVYRVLAYVLLLRDEYPPFRLDQGPLEPAGDQVPAGAPQISPSGPAPAPPPDGRHRGGKHRV
ncbi:DUF4389 domain-containing protein [Paeniglutamicibacter sp. R2-26]|uniref:DUF4389 domain-containing protein n=1 Tax=Paeniglutamicibacter sp. R2-26 TaxID=3144417 RepID=UPI003EE6ADA4